MKKYFTLPTVLFLAASIYLGCSNESTETTSENTGSQSSSEVQSAYGNQNSDVVNVSDDKLKTAEINCEGMTCTGCENTVEKKVSNLKGVKEVKADHKKKTVTVKYVEGEVTTDDMEKSITEAGYKVVKN